MKIGGTYFYAIPNKCTTLGTHMAYYVTTYTRLVAYATGRASHARQVKGDDPDKKGYLGPPGWGFGVRLTTPHSKN
jgi:hypothetical protein